MTSEDCDPSVKVQLQEIVALRKALCRGHDSDARHHLPCADQHALHQRLGDHADVRHRLPPTSRLGDTTTPAPPAVASIVRVSTTAGGSTASATATTYKG